MPPPADLAPSFCLAKIRPSRMCMMDNALPATISIMSIATSNRLMSRLLPNKQAIIRRRCKSTSSEPYLNRNVHLPTQNFSKTTPNTSSTSPLSPFPVILASISAAKRRCSAAVTISTSDSTWESRGPSSLSREELS